MNRIATETSIILIGSLKRLSPISVPEMSSFMLILLNIGMRVAGSVGDIIAPNRKPMLIGAPKMRENRAPPTRAVTITPRVSSDMILRRWRLMIRKFM